MYRPDPIISSSPPAARSPSRSPPRSSGAGEPQATYVTQPTQILEKRSPFFAIPGSAEPTLLVSPPRANRIQPVESSQLQVPRSSPPAIERRSSPSAMSQYSQSQRFGGFSGSAMAPPGTSFLPPRPVPKQIFDLTSDDPPVEPDSDEEELRYNTSKVEETPEKKPMIDLSAYAYNVNAAKKRPAGNHVHGTSTPPKRPKTIPPQHGPSRAMPVDLTDDDMTLEDIADSRLRKSVERLLTIFPARRIQDLYDALMKKKGHFDDACELLSAHDSDDELLRSPQVGVAQKNMSKPQPKQTAQRKLNAPVKTLAEKYSRPSNATQAYATPSATASPTKTEDDEPKKKRRLIRGRRKPLASSPPPTPQKAKVVNKQDVVVLSDDEDEGIAEVIDDDSDAAVSVASEHDWEKPSLLAFFNGCTVGEMADLSKFKKEEIEDLLENRPFASIDAIRAVHVDLQVKKEGKKKGRKPHITFGSRLVDAASDMWDAYSTIDRIVDQSSIKGKPMIQGMAKWGIDIFGASKDGELEITTLDSGSGTSRDSGYHSPSSDQGSDEEKQTPRKSSKSIKLLSKPSIMSKDLELKDYQVVGLNWLNLLYTNNISGILADDMGLGKTCQVIAFLSHLKEQNEHSTALIVVPGSTLENWCREFQRFSPSINFTPYYGSQAERFSLQDEILGSVRSKECDVIITTYDLAYRKEDNIFLRKCRPDVCIFDEGHCLKNANTQRYKALMKFDKSRCRILLTGTPLQNSLEELMSILGFLMPDVFYGGGDDDSTQEMLQTLFKHKAKVTESDSHSTLLSARRIERARTMLTPFILRRKKVQVLKHLPKKTSRVEYCDLTDTQKELYNAQLERQRKILQDRAAGVLVKDHANVMMKLRQAAIHPLLFRHRYDDKKIKQMSKACLKEEMFAESNPDIIYEELQIYQDYQCHQLALKYPRALKKFELQNHEWMDSGKVSALLALLKKYKENGDRALVFSQFTSVMDILSWVFEEHQINFMRMDGSTPIAERQSLLDVFYADTDIQLFMISTKSGGAGINLACANKVIIFDSSFNPQDDIQAENRAHRVGQTREVEVVRLVTRGTVEEQIYALGRKKLELDQMVQGEGIEEKKGKAKKGAAGDALSSAEQAGIEAVEQMLLEQMQAGCKEIKEEDDMKSEDVKSEVDVKDQFLTGLKKAGLDVGT